MVGLGGTPPGGLKPICNGNPRSPLRKGKGNERCSDCNLCRSFCISSQLVELRSSQPTIGPSSDASDSRPQASSDVTESGIYDEVDLVLLTHPKEWRKASSTGKLVRAICNDDDEKGNNDDGSCEGHSSNSSSIKSRPWGHNIKFCSSRLILYEPSGANAPLQVHLSKWQQGGNSTGPPPMVLFPSPDATSFSSTLEACGYQRKNSSNHIARYQIPPSNSSQASGTASLRLIILDGTWREARRMLRKIPCWVHRVKLSSEVAPVISKFHIRRQSQFGRISTVEAVSSLFQEIAILTEPASNGFFATASILCLRALEVLVDAVIRQSHKEPYREILLKRNSQNLTNRNSLTSERFSSESDTSIGDEIHS